MVAYTGCITDNSGDHISNNTHCDINSITSKKESWTNVSNIEQRDRTIIIVFFL